MYRVARLVLKGLVDLEKGNEVAIFVGKLIELECLKLFLLLTVPVLGVEHTLPVNDHHQGLQQLGENLPPRLESINQNAFSQSTRHEGLDWNLH